VGEAFCKATFPSSSPLTPATQSCLFGPCARLNASAAAYRRCAFRERHEALAAKHNMSMRGRARLFRAKSGHSITSSARASRVGAISRLSALADLRLIKSSMWVGNSTGRSPGLAPFKILST
jgi:hypothetical protein